MSAFLYPPTYLVYQLDNDMNNWVPALFDHRERQYFVGAETLTELVPLMIDGTVTGDSDPITDLRVCEVGSGDLYALNDHSEFVLVTQEESLVGPDKHWFDFV